MSQSDVIGARVMVFGVLPGLRWPTITSLEVNRAVDHASLAEFVQLRICDPLQWILLRSQVPGTRYQLVVYQVLVPDNH